MPSCTRYTKPKQRNIEWEDPVTLKDGSIVQHSIGPLGSSPGAYHISTTGFYGDSRYMLYYEGREWTIKALSYHRYLSDARKAAEEHKLTVDTGFVSTEEESNDE